MGVMSRIKTASLIGILLVLAAALFVLGAGRAAASPSHTVTVKWLISHQPTDVFQNATKVFAEDLARGTNGRLTLEIVTPDQVGISKGDIPNNRVMQLLDSGDVQLATTYTVPLGRVDPALWSLNLPYAFTSYEQVPAILDGSVGEKLLQSIGQKTSAEGLAFTMSGGFRIIVSKSATIKTPDDFSGLRIGTSGGPVAEATLRALGAVPVSLNLESGAVDPTTLDGVETTYSRLSEVLGTHSDYLAHINETDHSLFLTVILANKTFMNSLSRADQAVLKAAALHAAQVERQDSIALGERTKAALSKNGSIVTTLDASAAKEFQLATAPVYSSMETLLGSSTVASLRAISSQ